MWAVDPVSEALIAELAAALKSALPMLVSGECSMCHSPENCGSHGGWYDDPGRSSGWCLWAQVYDGARVALAKVK